MYVLITPITITGYAALATKIRCLQAIRSEIADNNKSRSFFHRLNPYIACSSIRSKSFQTVSVQVLTETLLAFDANHHKFSK